MDFIRSILAVIAVSGTALLAIFSTGDSRACLDHRNIVQERETRRMNEEERRHFDFLVLRRNEECSKR
jgi:hypothetical protein